MQPNKIESVHNYLTPKRMLSSLLKSSSKSKINRSLTEDINANSNPIAPLDTSIEQQPVISRRQTESYKKKPANDPFNAVSLSSNNNTPNNRFVNGEKGDQKKVYNQQNVSSSRISKTSKNSAMSDNLLFSNNNFDKNGSTSKRGGDQINSEIVPTRKFGNLNKLNPDIYRLSIQQTVNKLTKIKDSLQSQISGLKKLLDETSTSLENMDEEYGQFKEKILFFVSQSLDSAFKEYKRNLPNWAIYESVEEKGLNKIAEVNHALEICQSEQKLKEFGGKEALEKVAQQGKSTAHEVKDAKQQCLAQRPIISQQKLKKLQLLLKQIGRF